MIGRSGDKAGFGRKQDRRTCLIQAQLPSLSVVDRSFVVREWHSDTRETIVEAVVDTATGRVLIRKPHAARASIEADDLLIVSRCVAVGTMAAALAATLADWSPLTVLGMSVMSLVAGLSLARSRRLAGK